MGQPGFFDLDERYQRLSENGDPLVKLAALIDFEAFRPKLATALKRSDRSKVQTAVKIYGQWTLEGQEDAANALAWSHGVKAANSFAIKVPSTIEVLVPRGLPPREHPGQTERRRRERIREIGNDTRRKFDLATARRRSPAA